jgi:hypothetical protein
MTQTSIRKDVDLILEFLTQIGIEFKIEDAVQGSFAPNIDIRKGVVHFDYDKVLIVDLLHESGHLALVLKEHRPLLSGNLYRGLKQYTTMINKLPFEDPRMNILMSCDDTQVTAWAWAVGQKLGLNPNDVITSESYGGEGDGIRTTLSFSDRSSMPYIGVSMLHHAGFTKKHSHFAKEREPDARFYPYMNYWTTDEALLKNNFSLDISACMA